MTRADSYERCLAHSEKVYWNLADATRALDFDMGRRFLPDRVAGVDQLAALGDGERLALNQIRGFSYAHLFLFVEEFIIPQVMEQSAFHVHVDPTANRALLRFAEEELKHQALFCAVIDHIHERFGTRCEGIGGRVEVARAVLEAGDLPVMLLTSMLEWITQRHYLECFRDERSGDLDPSYREVFRLHWIEEAQHARLDTLELKRLSAHLSPEEGAAVMDGLFALCESFDALLLQQIDLDLDAFGRKTGRVLSGAARDDVFAAQRASYRWTFFSSGLEHPIFQDICSDLTPDAPARLAAALERFAA